MTLSCFWAGALRGDSRPIRNLEQLTQRVLRDLGHAQEYVFVIPIVIRDVVGARILGHQPFALIERHLENQRIRLFPQADQQFSFHLQGWSAVGSTFLDIRKRERYLPYRFVCDPEPPLHNPCSVPG